MKLFRKIRQQLINNRRFNNYLIYAFSETLLVVIGILIALQINNWNETRKERILEIDMLNSFVADLNNDIQQLEFNILRTKNRDAKIDTIFMILENPSDKDLMKFIRLQSAINADNYFISNQGTFDQGVSSGTLKYIKNINLRVKIFYYYEKISNNKSDDNVIYNITNDYITPIMIEEIFSKRTFIELITGHKTKAPEIDLTKLASNQKYYQALIYSLSDKIQLNNWSNFKIEAINLKKNIELELKHINSNS